jgi:hypothetical protein
MRRLVSPLLLAILLTACGTVEVGLLDDSGETREVTSTTSPAVEPAITEQSSVTPTTAPPAETPEAPAASTESVQAAPAGWQQFQDEEHGIELWHPPGTTVVIGQPARPVFSNSDYPEGIVEEQVFVARVMQQEGESTAPRSILEVKLVAKPEERPAVEMADLYSKRCPGPLQGPIEPTTINVQLSGYRYACEGMDGIIFNEFWSPVPGNSDLLFGAAWADMFSPLADEILATVAL